MKYTYMLNLIKKASESNSLWLNKDWIVIDKYIAIYRKSCEIDLYNIDSYPHKKLDLVLPNYDLIDSPIITINKKNVDDVIVQDTILKDRFYLKYHSKVYMWNKYLSKAIKLFGSDDVNLRIVSDKAFLSNNNLMVMVTGMYMESLFKYKD